ncbi:MAG: phosphate acyltransferase PlsX [Chitinophagaceae bacterium]|nr:phosphate acyltransferase PlsX [Chitinophagaceae bacterium]
MNIALDMMGGDFAPEMALKGVKKFLDEHEFDGTITMLGDNRQLSDNLHLFQNNQNKIKIIPTTQVIEMNEHPTRALKEKTDSSITVGFHLLAQGNTDAFISAGNTGAMMVGAMYTIKSIEGIIRPAIGAYIPQEDGKLSLLIDVGLNADCRAENLLQFAILGSLFSKYILRINEPRVALLNVGEEEGKGNLISQAAYPLLKENDKIHFVGNAEGRDLLKDKADVYVCEGFTGNVLLKFAESFYDLFQKRKIKDAYLEKFNFEMYGGVPVLGVNKPVIIGHGISGEAAFCNMIEIARRMIEKNFTETVKNAF